MTGSCEEPWLSTYWRDKQEEEIEEKEAKRIELVERWQDNYRSMVLLVAEEVKERPLRSQKQTFQVSVGSTNFVRSYLKKLLCLF